MSLLCKIGSHDYDGCVCQSCGKVKRINEVFLPKEMELLILFAKERFAMKALTGEEDSGAFLVLATLQSSNKSPVSVELSNAIVKVCKESKLEEIRKNDANDNKLAYLDQIRKKAEICLKAFGAEYDRLFLGIPR